MNRDLRGPKKHCSCWLSFSKCTLPRTVHWKCSAEWNSSLSLRSTMCSREIEAIDADRLSRNGGTKVHSYLELSSDSQVWFPALPLLWDLVKHWLKTSALAQHLCWRHIQKGRSGMETNFAENIGPQLMEEPGRVACAVVPWSHLMFLDISLQAVSLDQAVGSVLGTPVNAFSILQTLLEKRQTLVVILAENQFNPPPNMVPLQEHITTV